MTTLATNGVRHREREPGGALAVIREMHHRVKNNLQTIAMLRGCNCGTATRSPARSADGNHHRILSIASVHEILSVEGFRLINLRQLLERLAGMSRTP